MDTALALNVLELKILEGTIDPTYTPSTAHTPSVILCYAARVGKAKHAQRMKRSE